MWESRRDFQRVWEGWEAGFLAFHAFHTVSFPWPAFRPCDAGFTATSTSAMGCTRKEMFVVSALAIWHQLKPQPWILQGEVAKNSSSEPGGQRVVSQNTVLRERV